MATVWSIIGHIVVEDSECRWPLCGQSLDTLSWRSASADGHCWTHCRGGQRVQMATVWSIIGHIVVEGSECRWPLCGKSLDTLLWRTASADGHCWTHCRGGQRVQMATVGHIVVEVSECRWPLCGKSLDTLLWRTASADGHCVVNHWTHCCGGQRVQMATVWSIIGHIVVEDSECRWPLCGQSLDTLLWRTASADGHCWTHCCGGQRVQMATVGHIVVEVSECRWPLCGQSLDTLLWRAASADGHCVVNHWTHCCGGQRVQMATVWSIIGHIVVEDSECRWPLCGQSLDTLLWRAASADGHCVVNHWTHCCGGQRVQMATVWSIIGHIVVEGSECRWPLCGQSLDTLLWRTASADGHCVVNHWTHCCGGQRLQMATVWSIIGHIVVEDS
ncbi:hypothetical protein ACOMHN_034668 [Nucella lapillus]